MYFNSNELIEMVVEWQANNHKGVMWWWYRDNMLQAQDRGLIKITANTNEMPFWWMNFSDSIEITEAGNAIINRMKQKDNH